MSSSTYLEAVSDLARLTGGIAHQYYQRQVSIETKIDGTPVTIADRTAEQAAREWIEQRFPDDGFIGEEFPPVREGAKRTWIIDPIDGTKSFVREVPLWGSLVAVVENDRVIAGAAFFPAIPEMIAAAIDCGCWWNNSRTYVSTEADITNATILTSALPFSSDGELNDKWQKLQRKAGITRTWGDCFGYLMVATGRAEVMADPVLSSWDIAAFLPIIDEAGGVLTDFTGAHTAFGGSAIATNAKLDKLVREILVSGGNIRKNDDQT